MYIVSGPPSLPGGIIHSRRGASDESVGPARTEPARALSGAPVSLSRSRISISGASGGSHLDPDAGRSHATDARDAAAARSSAQQYSQRAIFAGLVSGWIPGVVTTWLVCGCAVH